MTRANLTEGLRELAGVGLFLALPALVWTVFWSGDGANAAGRALTGDEWRARYEAPLVEAAKSEADEAGWVRFDGPGQSMDTPPSILR